MKPGDLYMWGDGVFDLVVWCDDQVKEGVADSKKIRYFVLRSQGNERVMVTMSYEDISGFLELIAEM